MISSRSLRYVVSNLGWVDDGSLWFYDSSSHESHTIPVDDARHIALAAGEQDTFSAVQHYDGSHVSITVRHFASPGAVLARADVNGRGARVTGDHAVWPHVPRAYVAYLRDHGGYCVIRVRGENSEIAALRWFNDDPSWDRGYQSVIAVTEIPGTGELLFGMQRSSDLILCDAAGQEVRRKIRLSGATGNPVPRVMRSSGQIWAVDYDTVVRVDRETWDVTGSVRLQPAADGTRMFTGDLWISPDERAMLIPRPGSGDVVALDPVTLDIIGRAHLGRQPLVAAKLADGAVIARDWKTGDLLTAEALTDGNPDHPQRP